MAAEPHGRLTVHALDIEAGTPAAGMALSLFRIQDDTRTRLGDFMTDADGRCARPLLEGAALAQGDYEIVFAVGAWRAARGAAGRGFYDSVPIRFRITDPAAAYHVPLILAPHGYSTYRGS